jgi:hypothetical protein
MNDQWTQRDELDTLRAAYDYALELMAEYPCDEHAAVLDVARDEYERAEKRMMDMEMMR